MGIYDRDHRQNDPWKKNKDVHNFNQSADARRKLQEFKQTWKLDKPKEKGFISFLPWFLALLIILAVSKEVNKHISTNTTTDATSSQNVEQPIFQDSKALAIPLTSILSTTYDQEFATCPFTLIADNKNYYVKVCDTMRGNKTIAKFFIRAGEELTTKVPAGNYKIKYGSGEEWYGEEELFGQFSQYGESENLDFSFDGYSSQGNTISFYPRVNGNFHTNNIGRDAVLKN